MHEACGDFAAAVRVYRASSNEEELLDAYHRSGMRHAAAAKPLRWVKYANAAVAAGFYAEAEAAIEAGLQRLDGLLTEEDRTSMHIELLHVLLQLHETTGARGKYRQAQTRLFAAQMPLVAAAEAAAGVPLPAPVDIGFNAAAHNYECVGPRSGLRFMVTQRQGEHYGVPMPRGVMHRIIKLPPGTAAPTPHPDALVDRTILPFRANAELFSLPRAPTAACAECGAPGVRLQRCAACMTTAYCSRACQVKHWKAHKKDCKAARAAGSGGA